MTAIPTHASNDTTAANRRTFLQRLTVTGLALGALPSTLTAESAPRGAGQPFERLPHALPPQAQTYDVSWTKKLTGKHKAVYDSPDVSSGLAVYRAGIVAAQYTQVFKVPTSAVSNVIVLRHDGITLAMNQAFWDRYKIGALKKVLHPMTEEPTTKNPALLTEADGVPGFLAAFALDKQLKAGVVVLACELAFNDMVGIVAKTDGLDEKAAQTKALSMMLPGIIMQPSGVFATTLAQENGCVYVRAS